MRGIDTDGDWPSSPYLRLRWLRLWMRKFNVNYPCEWRGKKVPSSLTTWLCMHEKENNGRKNASRMCCICWTNFAKGWITLSCYIMGERHDLVKLFGTKENNKLFNSSRPENWNCFLNALNISSRWQVSERHPPWQVRSRQARVNEGDSRGNRDLLRAPWQPLVFVLTFHFLSPCSSFQPPTFYLPQILITFTSH